MKILSTIRQLLSNPVVCLSEPFPYGQSWAYLFASNENRERRIFNTEGEAMRHLATTKSGLALGGGLITVKQISPDRIPEFEVCSNVRY
jgi:hypothetical protein